MCEICLNNPCLERCPNADEPIAVTYCAECGRGIEEGEEYGRYDGDDYCEDCLNDMPNSKLVTLFGGDWKVAERHDC